MDGNNRVVLTPEVLQALGIAPGDHVTFAVDGRGAVRLRKLPPPPEAPGKHT